MAGILQYLDFNDTTTMRKLPHSHKRHNDGLEAPRNSVEFAIESCQSFSVVHEDIPYSCHMRYCSKPNSYSNGVSVKKLIEQEISSKTNEISKRPSVVARLMGMDPLPDPITSSSNLDEEFNDQKPQTREKHPQEEELQKFKTEFEAWQSSKLLERSRSLELENFGKHKFVQSLSLPQKNKGKEISEKPLSPTRIVILKPCPEMNFNLEDSNIPSPEIIKRENNMNNFLEEVKNRLKLEIEGKFGENKTDPKQIARNIANQIRETVVRDINQNTNSTLTRSESARWYRTGTQEIKDAKKILSERIKNVLRREIENAAPPSPHRTKPIYDIKRKGIKVKNQIEETEQVSSPRNLVRSFSAPVSGTGFVKLLTEEMDVSGGTRLERKHEASCEHERKGRKEVSERNGKGGNLRQNLGLRKWLFGKRFQSADEQTMQGFMPVQNFVTTPSVVVNSRLIQENFTEVPPSPASLCNSPRDEICRGVYSSPISPLDFIDEHTFIEGPKEILQINPFQVEEKPIEDEVMEIDDHEKSFVKNVLVMAGLYENESNQILSKPISNSVFEQVEETFGDKTNSDEVASDEPICDCESSISHRILFDLTNEVLPSVVQIGVNLKKWGLGPVRVPYGKRLLNEVWRRIEKLKGFRKVEGYSLDELIYDDLRENSWRGDFNEEIGEWGAEIELELVDELIDELFWDVLLNIGEITR